MKPMLDSQTALLFQLVKKREKQGVVKIAVVLGKKPTSEARPTVGLSGIRLVRFESSDRSEDN